MPFRFRGRNRVRFAGSTLTSGPLAPSHLVANPAPAPTPTPTPTPTPAPSGNPITALNADQPALVWPGFQNDPSAYVFLTPVGGIGPYTYSSSDKPAQYALGNDGVIRNSFSTPGAANDTFHVTVTDALGSTFTRSVTVNKFVDNVPYLFIGGKRTITNNVVDPVYEMAWPVSALGGDFANGSNISITEPTGTFLFAYGQISPTYGNHTMFATGTYTCQITAVSPNGTTLTGQLVINIVPFTPISDIHVSTGTVSTSLAAGVVIGSCAATTPNNTPHWSLADDAGGSLQIDVTRGLISPTRYLAAGPLTFSVKVTDKVATFTKQVTVNVQQGTVLPPSNMVMTINPNLLNVGRGQNIGTPTVSGVTGTHAWTMIQENFTTLSAYGALPLRYAIDPNTGAITAPGLLSAMTDKLVVTCSDGINTCTQTFNVAVGSAPVTTTYHVGRGMVALHGANGFEHIVDCRKMCNGADRTDTVHVLIYADADDDYYANDTGILTADWAARYAWVGPIIVEGVAANGKPQPRTGGGMTQWSNCGADMRGKGFWVFGDGDATMINIRVSHCFGSDQTHGIEAVRKDGATYGNFTMQKCRIDNCDNGFESGYGGSNILIEDCEIVGCGTSHVSAGACHNFYIGGQWSATVRRCLSVSSMTGHEFKCRATKGLIENNRFYDLERGGASCQMDLPNGGDYIVQGNKFHKGTMAQNPYSLQYAAEFDPSLPDYAVNTLVAQNNSFFIATLDGNHTGTPAAIRHWNQIGFHGAPSTVHSLNNSFWLTPHSTTISNSNSAAAGNTTESGNIILTAPPLIDLSRPWLPGTFERLGWFRVVTQWGQDDFANYDGVQIDCGVDDIRIPVATASGTVLGTCAANVNMDTNAGVPVNPFVAGTAWSLVQDGVYYAFNNPNPWAPVGRYAISTNPDGTGTLTVAGALVAGVDFVQVLAVAPNGTRAKNRLYIAVV